MQRPQPAKPPLGIILDTDIGGYIDDALALAMLYGFDGKGEARAISISISRPSLQSVAYTEAVSRFYAGTVSGAFGAVGRTLPIGLRIGAKVDHEPAMLTVPLSKRDEKNELVYPHGIEKLNDTAEVPALLRNALTSQFDQNCVVVLIGPATNLAQVLGIPGIKELISRKVMFLSLMGGAYPAGEPEYNIKSDIAAAKKLFAEWPTPIVASGFEVGNELLFPAASLEKDFAWTPNHPVADAYRAYKKMPYDAETYDLTSLLYAVRPQEKYFNLSQPGTISVLEDGRTKFTAAPGGKHRYLILNPAQKDRILAAYVELTSAKPKPRAPRRPPPPVAVVEEKKPTP